MVEKLDQMGARISPSNIKSTADYLLYLRHLFAYEYATNIFSKKDEILEIGCGEGYGTSLISKGVITIVSLDVDLKTLRHAREKYGSNCNFTLYDGTNLPIKSDKFDGVISFQVIEHVRDESKYVSEVKRILKNDGIFLCTTPNRAYRLKPGQKPWNPFHLREYYAKDLENVLKNAFSEVEVVGIRGTDEVQEIEIKRVKQRGNLQKILNRIKLIVTNNLSIMPISGDFSRKYTASDFYITDNPNEGLDLLGICRKTD
jgi:ubiquinone/menaquinone biosynthesis C-methylase UbiE